MNHVTNTQKIVDLTEQKDKAITRRAHLYDGADALSREARALSIEIEAISREIEALTPINNTVAWIPSHSRVGSHLTVVIDGEGFCTCEDARYRNPEGGCKHYTEAVFRGFHDARAEFKGGFDGPVTTEPANGAILDQLIDNLSSVGVFSTPTIN